MSCSLATFAKDKEHLPLPPSLMSAKAVYIDNRGGYAELGDRAYQALREWGRFQVVQDRSQADLIFRLAVNVRDTAQRAYTWTVLSVIDAKTGDLLWSESEVWGPFRWSESATKRAIGELRKRIDAQTAHATTP